MLPIPNQLAKIRAVSKCVFNYLRKTNYCNNPPIRVWVEPTNNCNLRCISCANRLIKDEEKGFMDFNLFKKIIDQLSGYSHEIYLYMAGEPLLHPKITEMIDYVKKYSLLVNINTNVYVLDKSMSKKILATKLDKITFSIDSLDKDAYEKNRINAKFDNVIKNIVTFLELRKKQKNKMEVFLRLSELYVKDTKKSNLIKNSLLKYNISITIHHTHDWCGKIRLPIYFSRKNYVHCFHTYAGLAIQWNGNVVPCCRDFLGEYSLGNVNEEPINEIWNNKKMRKLRKMLVHKRYKEIPLCRNCDMLWSRTLFRFPLKIIKSYIRCKE